GPAHTTDRHADEDLARGRIGDGSFDQCEGKLGDRFRLGDDPGAHPPFLAHFGSGCPEGRTALVRVAAGWQIGGMPMADAEVARRALPLLDLTELGEEA